MAKRIYVGNLPWSYDASKLESLFGEFGNVISAEVISDRMTGKSRWFGFVQMDSDQAMQQAIDSLNLKEIDGRALTVNEAREREQRGRRM